MDDLYERDLVLWSRQQAEALRAAGRQGSNTPIDFENVAEEIETLGRSERRALSSLLGTVAEHLMKLEASPATAPRGGWTTTVLRARRDIAKVLQESPSLRPDLDAVARDEMATARRLVELALRDHGGMPVVDLESLDYSGAQLTGDWLPGRG